MILTCVSFEYLHDLSALQVPEIDFVIFAAGHDPLAACDAEASGNAVLLVPMTHVGLQASRCLVIPQTDCTIVRSREDVLGVRRELYVLTIGPCE